LFTIVEYYLKYRVLFWYLPVKTVSNSFAVDYLTIALEQKCSLSVPTLPLQLQYQTNSMSPVYSFSGGVKLFQFFFY